VLDRVTPEMRIYHEETFGPVKCIVRVNGVEEAIACANDNEYGLSAAVFGRDIARAFNVARRIDSGICHVNGPTVHDEAQMPFGGVKGSGMGRFGGKAGIAEFTELRWITVQTHAAALPVLTDGSVSAKGAGLLFGSGDLIATRGTVAAVAVTLFCGAADATARRFTSPSGALDLAGNFNLKGTLSEDGINPAVMPATCDNPQLLVRSFNTSTGLPGNWFAAGIVSSNDDD
jgi:hypothetical protein